MAHNPPIPARIDFADRLGVLIMDENRDYGGHRGQGGWTSETVDQEVIDMGDMVQVSSSLSFTITFHVQHVVPNDAALSLV
eukprot:COSAG02_NODE_9292_length_2264_cov_6.776132_1_plen_80_part_10